MNLLDKKINLILLIIGWLTIFFFGLLSPWGWVQTIGLLSVWFLLFLFLNNPLFGLLTVLFLRPLADKFSSLEFGLPFSDNLSVKLSSFLGIFVVALALLYFLKRKVKFWRFPFFKVWFFLGTVLAVSVFYSLDPYLSFYEFLRVVSISVFFFLMYDLGKTPTNRRKIIRTIFWASLLPMLLAFYQLLTHSGLGGTSGIESRLYGSFSHPNSFASFLIIILSLAFWKLDTIKKSGKKILFFSLFFLALFLLLETFSRGAWLAVMTFFFLYGILKSPKIIFALFSLGIVLFLFVPGFHDRVEDIYNPPADSSIVWRLQKWQRVLAVTKKHPWLGAGAGTEVAVHEKEYGFYAGNPYTHNDFLKLFLENGLLGLTAFIFLLSSTLFQLLKKYLSLTNDSEKKFVLTIILLLLAETVFSLSSNIWRGTATMWFLWTLIALALSLKASDAQKS